MKKSKPAKLLLGVLGLATFASLVGTVSGTLAWYAYSTRATVSYSGTSVNNTVQLEIGLVSKEKILSTQQIVDKITNDDSIDVDEKVELLEKVEDWFNEFWDVMLETQWNGDPNYYYFAPVGKGLTYKILNAYLKSNGYATDSLAAVTSGSYKRGDVFSLRTSPNPDPSHNLTPANKFYYSVIPFVFRVTRSNTIVQNNYVEGAEIWLSDATVRASVDENVDNGDIYKAVRVFIDRDNTIKKNDTDLEPYYSDDFIFNPSATSKGETVVAGVLDLTRDHYYDYDENDNEIIYGDYESIGGIKPSFSFEGENEIDDLNGTNKSGTDYDTFTARHRPGINYYDNYDNCVFKTAEYECLKNPLDPKDGIAPRKDEVTGILYNRDPLKASSVCLTNGESDHYLGRVDFTVFLEGWDHNVIDEEYEHAFDLGLTFEINKLGA